MFVTESSTLLPHAALAVDPFVGRLALLTRWQGGLRRATTPLGARVPCRPESCGLLYVARDLRLALHGATLARTPGACAEHRAIGDGVTFTWTLTLGDESRTAGRPATRLHVRTTLEVDEAHPTAAYRAALYRLVARRAPDDLARLRALLARYVPHAAPAGPDLPVLDA